MLCASAGVCLCTHVFLCRARLPTPPPQVAFHSTYPLFATASDDGKLHILHGTVYTDLLTNPLIVPVKIIEAHTPVDDVGVLDTCFHPTQPWIFSAGADKAVRLFS